MNSLVDQYDDRIFRNGQQVGVRYGGTVHQPTINYEVIPQKLPDPPPKYGQFSPPTVTYQGGFNIPGAAGNLAMSVLDNYEIAGAPRYIRGNFAPSGAIIRAPHLDSPYMDEQIRRGFVPMTPPVRRPAGPQLPGFV